MIISIFLQVAEKKTRNHPFQAAEQPRQVDLERRECETAILSSRFKEKSIDTNRFPNNINSLNPIWLKISASG